MDERLARAGNAWTTADWGWEGLLYAKRYAQHMTNSRDDPYIDVIKGLARESRLTTGRPEPAQEHGGGTGTQPRRGGRNNAARHVAPSRVSGMGSWLKKIATVQRVNAGGTWASRRRGVSDAPPLSTAGQGTLTRKVSAGSSFSCCYIWRRAAGVRQALIPL